MSINSQIAFDTVAAHLLKQGKPSRGMAPNCKGEASCEGNTICRYRGDKGRSCAIGVLIPDDQYDVKMEGRDAEGLLKRFPALEPFLPSPLLAMDLQTVHDECDRTAKNRFDLRDLKRRLREVAIMNGLEAPASIAGKAVA